MPSPHLTSQGMDKATKVISRVLSSGVACSFIDPGDKACYKDISGAGPPCAKAIVGNTHTFIHKLVSTCAQTHTEAHVTCVCTLYKHMPHTPQIPPNKKSSNTKVVIAGMRVVFKDMGGPSSWDTTPLVDTVRDIQG